MSQRYSINVYDIYGTCLGNWSTKMDDLTFSTGQNGFDNATGVVRMPTKDAFYWYSLGRLMVVKIAFGGLLVWEGRIEDIGVLNMGLRFTAYGFWRAYTDTRDTALYSTPAGFEGWKTLDSRHNPYFVPEVFEITTQPLECKISPRKGETFWYEVIGAVGFIIPDQGRREITKFQFNYDINLPADWFCAVRYGDADLGLVTVPAVNHNTLWSHVSTGAGHSGSSGVLTLSPAINAPTHRNEMIYFILYYNDVTPTEYAGETGESYFKISYPQISTGDDIDVSPDFIVRDMIDLVSGLNPTQANTSKALVEPVDAYIAGNYEDTAPSDILEGLSEFATGDIVFMDNPPTYEVGVWEDRRLHYRPKYSYANTYYVNIGAIEVERLMETLYNGVYVKYRSDRTDQDARTPVAYDVDSIDRYDLKRVTMVDHDDTSGSEAEMRRDKELRARRTISPRAGIEIKRLYNQAGGQVPLAYLRAGDLLIVKNLTPALVPDIDNVTVFRVAATEFDVVQNELRVDLDVPMPTLARMLAEGLRG
jgi:hypothetical protein